MVYRSLNAGRLNRMVTIQSRSAVDDGGGGQAITWTDVMTIHASVSPGQGREFVAAKQVTPELTHQILIRYRPNVTAKHRLKYVTNGIVRVFSISAVLDPEERHEQLLLLCSEQPVV